MTDKNDIPFRTKPLAPEDLSTLSSDELDRKEIEVHEEILRTRLQAVFDHLNTLIGIGRARHPQRIFVVLLNTPLRADEGGATTVDFSASPTIKAFIDRLREHVEPIGLTVAAELAHETMDEGPSTIWITLVPKEEDSR